MPEINSEMHYIRRNSPGFPGRFEGISGSPEGLYVIGELPRDDQPTVGIVGARMCSRYGHETAYEFGRVLAGKGVQIISGLALGIDCYAQEGALAGGGKTFAVLGCGADICYPKSNREVYEKIKTSGGILSEEKPGTPPLAYNFPKRNRIISALSDIVLVVEAKEKSGSLITVDFALEQGKTVYAVPGRVCDLLSYGCNSLIAQGAGIACSPIRSLWSWNRRGHSVKQPGGAEKRGTRRSGENAMKRGRLRIQRRKRTGRQQTFPVFPGRQEPCMTCSIGIRSRWMFCSGVQGCSRARSHPRFMSCRRRDLRTNAGEIIS